MTAFSALPLRPPLRGLARLATAVCVLVGACSAPPHEHVSSAPSASASPTLPSRAEAVARADALSVEAEKVGGAVGAEKLVEAARLRTRLYRTESVSADALEATELYRRAAKTPFSGQCDAEVDLALLEGELAGDPSAQYRALYRARAHHRGEPCRERIERVLGTLSAFEPTPEARAELDRELGGAAAPSASPPTSIVPPDLVEPPNAEPARITGVEHYGGKDAARVVVRVTRPTRFSVGELPPDATHGPRLFVDIEHAVPKARHAVPADGLVERVRLGAQGAATRVVLDLSRAVSHRVFYLPEPFRLVVDVAPANAESDPATRAIRRVVLDPGHGGNDPGATGAGGLREKDVVLDIAHRAAPLIARELGISTLLTRDADVYVPLDERVARANAFSADLFVSIHCNASDAPGSRGVMTFVLDSSRDDLAARVAARENASTAAASAELANIMSQVLDRGNVARSHHFAELLQRSAIASLSPHYGEVSDQGVKSAGFYVLAGARMPAALFETSFISNPGEERRLDTADYRQKMADAVVNAVRALRDGL
ncbi:MAG TPA: N-acetylmuramoyl-L-alanine amidase [Polyangiaceae bacterium]|nr:N-acetylmuramoyl-L-alanine amidase [Polyangiaceae bacterium]